MANTPQNFSREYLKSVTRLVVKIGSSSLVDKGGELDNEYIQELAQEILHLQLSGKEIILVSSGAIAVGRTKIKHKPQSIAQKQACAAIGQNSLISAYSGAFKAHGMVGAQVLLTRDVITERERYLNAKNTLRQLLEWKIIPIVNENDTVAVEEIQFGENDILAAITAHLVEADLMVLLTDQQGLFTANPTKNKDARLIREIATSSRQFQDEISTQATGKLGSGGMQSKIKAAQYAAESHIPTIIADAREKAVLQKILAGVELGSLLYPDPRQLKKNAKSIWLSSIPLKAKLILDRGASQAITQKNRSLLPIGILEIAGECQRGDMVQCVDGDGVEVACGLVNYTSGEIQAILGKPSHCIESILGYSFGDEIIHRDDLLIKKTP